MKVTMPHAKKEKYKNLILLQARTIFRLATQLLFIPVFIQINGPDQFGYVSLITVILLIYRTITESSSKILMLQSGTNIEQTAHFLVAMFYAVLASIVNIIYSSLSTSNVPNISYLSIVSASILVIPILSLLEANMERKYKYARLLEAQIVSLAVSSVAYIILVILGHDTFAIIAFYTLEILCLACYISLLIGVKLKLFSITPKRLQLAIKRSLALYSNSFFQQMFSRGPILLGGIVFSYDVIGFMRLALQLFGASLQVTLSPLGQFYIREIRKISRRKEKVIAHAYSNIFIISTIAFCSVVAYLFSTSIMKMESLNSYYKSLEYFNILLPAFASASVAALFFPLMIQRKSATYVLLTNLFRYAAFLSPVIIIRGDSPNALLSCFAIAYFIQSLLIVRWLSVNLGGFVIVTIFPLTTVLLLIYSDIIYSMVPANNFLLRSSVIMVVNVLMYSAVVWWIRKCTKVSIIRLFNKQFSENVGDR